MNASDHVSERARVAERWLRSMITGEPDWALVTVDFEYEQHFGATGGLYVGRQGIERWVETFYEVWDRASMEVDSFSEAGDRIRVDNRVLVRAGKTGIEVELRSTGILQFAQDGRIGRMDAYNEAETADLAFNDAGA